MSFLPFHRRNTPGEKEPEPLPAHPSWETALSAEAEAFLEGRLVEHLAEAGRPVPAWAVLNKLAHANATELADLIKTGPGPGSGRGPRPRKPAWANAQQTSLASRLVDKTAAPDEITHLQHVRLIPLELWFIERSKTTTVTPRQVINATTDALNTPYQRP